MLPLLPFYFFNTFLLFFLIALNLLFFFFFQVNSKIIQSFMKSYNLLKKWRLVTSLILRKANISATLIQTRIRYDLAKKTVKVFFLFFLIKILKNLLKSSLFFSIQRLRNNISFALNGSNIFKSSKLLENHIRKTSHISTSDSLMRISYNV